MDQIKNRFEKMIPAVGRDENGSYFDFPAAITFGELTVEGSVGHDHYARLFGKARELFGVACIPRFVEEIGRVYLLFTCRAEYDFLENIFFGEIITVRVWVSKVGNSSFVISGEFLNGAGKVCATGEHVIVYVDAATRQKGMPQAFKRNLEGLIRKPGKIQI